MLADQERVVGLQETIDKLITIINYYRRPGNAETCRVVALQLRKQCTPDPKWGWNYVMTVANKRLNPGKRLCEAIDNLYSKLTESEINVKYERIEVLAPAGVIQSDLLITGKPKKCSSCNLMYYPASPRQIRCSKCRSLNYQKSMKKNTNNNDAK